MDDADDLAARPRLQGNIALEMDGAVFEFGLDLPDGPLNADDMTGVLQGLAGALADQAVKRYADAGQPVSCKRGCAACCRQAVPVTEAEARALAALVAAMPSPQRERVVARFDAAVRAVQASPSVRSLRDHIARGERAYEQTVVDYYHLQIDCPFLEDEACSIHASRPIVCRDYMVTSEPRHCFSLTRNGIRKVPLTSIFDGAAAVARDATPLGWLLLVDALDFAAQTPAPPRRRGGPDILKSVIETRPAKAEGRS
jgi:Fe-S-cluster containining protein